MFAKEYNSDNKDFSLRITVKCDGKKKFRIYASDYGKANSKYADRIIEVDNERNIFFSFPVSPKTLGIVAFNVDNPEDKDFSVDLMQMPLKSYNIFIDNETERFLKLAIPFCQVSGFKTPPPTGAIYQANDGEFTIKYLPQIRDYKTGQVYNTPARIGHNSGIIEIAKSKYDKYTIPMRLMIILHEYSHKYRNPKIGLEIQNEYGADINGLYIYLGLGFSKIDAICVFANVFLKAQTDGNIKRMRKIMDYIEKFENQEFAKQN
jgi:hypothetical protein